MVLDSVLTWSAIYEFYFRYHVEGYDGHHEVAHAFTKVASLNPDVPEEGIAGPSPNDHGCFWLYYCEEEFHGKTGSD